MKSTSKILITGTSRGIGLALARHYAEKGYSTFGCSRSDTDILHENYKHFVCDLNDEPSVLKMFSQLSKQGRDLDILINNAGVSQSRFALLTDAGTAERVLRDNFLPTFLATREALKIMSRNNHGRIINFSSINVPLGSAGSVVYNAAKAAIESISHGLANELENKNITINTIGISLVSGDGMAAQLSANDIANKKNRLAKSDPLEIEEIIHAIDFFTSNKAGNITDQVLYFGGPR